MTNNVHDGELKTSESNWQLRALLEYILTPSKPLKIHRRVEISQSTRQSSSAPKPPASIEVQIHEAAEASSEIKSHHLVEEVGEQPLETYANHAANAGSSTTNNSSKHSKLHFPLSLVCVS